MKSEQTHRQIIKMFEGLTSLSKRFLPTTPSDIKVARQLQWITPLANPLIAGRAKIASVVMEEAGIAEGEKIAGILAQSLMAKIIEAQYAFDETVIEIDVPERKITQADLPKERAGDDGWQNAAAMGSIVSDLGILFEFPKDE